MISRWRGADKMPFSSFYTMPRRRHYMAVVISISHFRRLYDMGTAIAAFPSPRSACARNAFISYYHFLAISAGEMPTSLPFVAARYVTAGQDVTIALCRRAVSLHDDCFSCYLPSPLKFSPWRISPGSMASGATSGHGRCGDGDFRAMRISSCDISVGHTAATPLLSGSAACVICWRKSAEAELFLRLLLRASSSPVPFSPSPARRRSFRTSISTLKRRRCHTLRLTSYHTH